MEREDCFCQERAVMNIKQTLLAVTLFAGPLCSSVVAANPLFETHEPLAVVLEFPADDLLRHAKKKPTVPGQLRYTDANGTDVALDLDLTSRGKSRLEQCRYPPLSINLKKKQTESTLFAGQNKLKLVTPCRLTTVYKDYLAQEYAIYRAYNLLSEHSFRVRMLEVTFHDSNGKREDAVHAAFLIESDKEVAARLDMTTVRPGFRGLLPQRQSYRAAGFCKQLGRIALRFRSVRNHQYELCGTRRATAAKERSSATVSWLLSQQ
jgi:hypothetical protein